MKDVWDRIHTWLAEHAPTVAVSLNKGASEKQLQAAEKKLGVTFPDDVRSAYRVHDGQDMAEMEPNLFLYGWEWLSLKRMVEEWRVWKELLDAGDFDEAHARVDADARVQKAWWHPGWVPLTYNGSGDHQCLDLAPARRGKVGQIISMWHDDGSRGWLSPSFAAWLGRFASELEQGDWVYSEDDGGLTNVDEL